MKLVGLALVLGVVAAPAARGEGRAAPRDSREALRPFNDLIGSWKATGIPEGSRAEKERGLWVETLKWTWSFKDGKAWLRADFAKGKHFARGELRYLSDQGLYRFSVRTTDAKDLVFTGRLEERRLVLERHDAAGKEDQRLVVSLLHPNRFLYSYEVKPAGRSVYRRLYRVGATKQGVPFASGDGQPECVVSGGLGTIKVTYRGKTYYVCCSGCRAEFNADPAKYVKEYEERHKAAASKPREK